MTPFEKVVQEMLEIHRRKNSDYTGDSGDNLANFRMAEKFGVSTFDGILVRMSDKYSRIASLVKKAKEGKEAAVQDESLRDTLIDLANYAIIAITAMEDAKEGHMKFDTSSFTWRSSNAPEFDEPDPDDESWNGGQDYGC